MSDTLGLGKLRETIAGYLRDGLSGDIGVFDAIPDSIAPPAIYVTWSNPWLLPQSFCQYVSAVQLICVAARIEPGGQFTVLENLVSETLGIMRDSRVSVRDVTAPYPITFAGVSYLAASINLVEDIGE